MHRLILCSLCLFGLIGVGCAAEPETLEPVGGAPILLSPDQINNVLITRGVTTVLSFRGGKPIDNIEAGSHVIEARLDEGLGRIFLSTQATAGATNMTVTAGGVDYVFVVQITSDPSQVVFTRSYVFGAGDGPDFAADLGRLARGRKMKPAEVNIDGLVKQISRAQVDPVYRQTLQDFRMKVFHRPYIWHGCVVHLMETDAFLDRDIMAVKVEWVNTSGYGLYLNAQQLRLYAAGKPVRIIGATQLVQDSIVEPGQMDTIWLVVQGERFGYMNDLELRFPSDMGGGPR